MRSNLSRPFRIPDPMQDTSPSAYRVLARKYRPETFADLVGQEAMVRTLKNAFAADRIAQAFIMTGIRGTGKTTTARIIAKGMNCIGPDGTGTPTTEPCGVCEHCVAIMEGRHVDVMEMDAASRTGVGDIREIIDSVRYRAASARYKIYIIDEVHMLSNNAFNALLKTLEEPPAHVKFIFATTEIRKVPVTVLSRCQRFDLRRIEPEDMLGLLRRIATAEGAGITDEALALITRAAEGSARDATSLLDQAISHGAGETQADQVRRYAEAVEAEFGGAHYFFNNAGILGPVTRSFLDYPEEAFDQVIAVNVKGVWLGLRAMAPLIAKSGGGAIVNTASVAGLGGTPTIFAYGASKHAVVGMTKSAAMSLGAQGVRVNAVCPAPIDTQMADQLTGTDDPAKIAERKERFAQGNLIGRIGEPEDVASLVTFLCSDDASFITGGIYTVDGGSRAR